MSEQMEDIEKIVVNLLSNRDGGIFYASLISQMRRIHDDKLPSCAGVTVRNGRIELYYNSKMLQEMTKNPKERIAVLEHECFPAGTFITGINKNIEDVLIGDKVIDAKGKRVKVVDTMKRFYNKELFNFDLIGASSFQITKNHPILVIGYNRTSIGRKFTSPQWMSPEKLYNMKNKRRNNGYYTLIPKLKCKVFPSILDLTPFIQRCNNSYKTLKLKLDENLAFALGFYTAEGHYNKGSFVFSGHRIKDKNSFDRIQHWLSSYGYTSNIYKRNGNYGVILQSRSSILGRAFQKWCGHRAKNKHIPDFILFNKDKRLLNAFLDGFYKGDGCLGKSKSGNYKILNTVSKTLAHELQLAISSLGEIATLSFKKNNPGGFSKPLHNSGLYRIDWRKDSNKVLKNFPGYIGIPIKKITKNKYKGYVYNLETVSHTYTINNITVHNCQHIVKNHLSRRNNRDAQLWNIAADIAINQHISNLPDWVCQWDKYPKKFKMQPDKSAEWYFERLKANSKQINIKQNKDGSVDVEVTDEKGNTEAKFKMGDPGDHKKWEEGEDSQDVVKEVIKQTVEKAIEQTEKMQGRIPGHLEADIKELRKDPIIPWAVMLKRWVAMRIKAGSRYTWKRPNKRFGITQKGRVPARKLSIAVAFDTSGSISDEELNTFMSETKAIMECYKSKFLILECDMELQKDYYLTPFSKIDTKVKGRGGTSFKPPFEYIEEKGKVIDLMIYFTDLCGDFPDSKPPYPVLWVSTYGSDMKVPFGEILDLQKHGWKRTNSW